MDEPVIRRVVCPGSFDPITNGHLDVIGHAAQLFDEVIVAVGVNAGKRGSMFTIDERLEQVRESTAEYGNVRAEPIDGLLVDFCTRRGVCAAMRGLRAVSDYEYELKMSHMNYRLSGVETLFVASDPRYSRVSSSLLKEVVSSGGDVAGLVPDVVLRALADRLAAAPRR